MENNNLLEWLELSVTMGRDSDGMPDVNASFCSHKHYKGLYKLYFLTSYLEKYFLKLISAIICKTKQKLWAIVAMKWR